MNHYDDLPNTHVFLTSLPGRVGTALGYTRCGCALPASCSYCRGDDAENREEWRDRRDAERRAPRPVPLNADELHALWLACLPAESRAMFERLDEKGTAA